MPEHKDIADLLIERFALVGEAFSVAKDPPCRGWDGYRHAKGLGVTGFYRGENIIYSRPDRGEREVVELLNIRPLDELRDPETTIVPVGDKETISGAKIRVENYNGLTPLTEKYESKRTVGTRREDVEFKNFTESVEIMLKAVQGSDTANFKFEQQFTIGASATHGDETHEEKSNEKGTVTGADPTAAPGTDARYWRTWTAQRSMVVHTGTGDIDCSVGIGTKRRGKHGRRISKWEAHKGKHKRHAYFPSFWLHLVPMLKGEGARDHDCYRWFHEHPAPDWLIEQVTAPIDLPFRNESKPFDDFSEIVGHKELIRGPNPEVLAKLKQFADAGVDASLT